MDERDRELLIEAMNLNSIATIEAIELNTEKVQELLERVECIDNTLDDIRDARGPNEQALGEYRENVLGWFQKLHTQGGRI